MFDQEEKTITLLDGESYKMSEVIDRMEDPEFYYDYLSSRVFSSTLIGALLKDPGEYQKQILGEQEYHQAYADGQAIHTLVLEPDEIEKRYEIVDVRDKRDSAWRELKKTTDKIMFTAKEWDSFEMIDYKIKNCSEIKPYFTDGAAEVSIVGEIFGYPFRGKADYLKSNHIVDLKTTRSLDGWEYKAKNVYNYDCQAFIYSSLFNVEEFTFIVAEKLTAKVKIVEVSKETIERGGYKVKRALEIYEEYFTNKNGSKKPIIDYVQRSTI